MLPNSSNKHLSANNNKEMSSKRINIYDKHVNLAKSKVGGMIFIRFLIPKLTCLDREALYVMTYSGKLF